MLNTKCYLCNSNEINDLKGYELKELNKCKTCGFVFMKRIPSENELSEHYSNYSYDDDQYLSPVTIESYNLLLDEFEKYRKNNKILDVGCGLGYFLVEAKKRGWEVYGTEYSNLAVQKCSKKGINMHEGVLNVSEFNKIEFDVITSFEVLEHINNPNDELSKIYFLLRKGGLFYATTPNFNSIMRYYLKSDYDVINYPEHLSYFTVKTIKDLLKMNNFRKIKILTTGLSITRIKTSKGNKLEKYISEVSTDELLRQKIASNFLLKLLKNVINQILTFFNLGLTLKIYYTKD